MEEQSKQGNRGLAADKACMDRKTARKYLRSGKLPSEMKMEKGERSYRTRGDPFALNGRPSGRSWKMRRPLRGRPFSSG